MGAHQGLLRSWQEQARGLIKDLPRALHDEGVKDTAVTVIANLSNIDRDSFWFVMDVTQFALRGPAGSVGNSNGAQIGDYVRHFDDAGFSRLESHGRDASPTPLGFGKRHVLGVLPNDLAHSLPEDPSDILIGRCGILDYVV